MIQGRHSTKLILAALVCLAAYQVLCVVSIVDLMTSPSGGWVFWEAGDGAVRAEPATPAAMKVAAAHRAPLQLESVNGHPVTRGADAAALRTRVDLRPAAQNRYALRDASGQRFSVTLPLERPTPGAFGEAEGGGILSILYHLLGIGFLLVGLYHWLRRPAAHAVRALLLFCLVAAFHMAEVYLHDGLSRLLLAVNMFFLPLLAPAGLHLAISFTDQGRPLFRRASALLLAGALVIGAILFTAAYLSPLGYAWVERLRQGALTAASVTMVAATALSFYTCWRVARLDTATLIQRLRAREMAKAMGLPLIIPCLWQLCRVHVASVQVTLAVECVQLAALAAFPVMVGNAIRLTELADRLHQAQCRLMDAETQSVLTRFIAGIVHEVNSPLGVLASGAGTIRRAVEILADGLPKGDAKQDRAGRRARRSVKVGLQTAETMESASKRIQALLSNLQRSISLDAAEYKELDLRTGLEDALQLLAPKLKGRVALKRDFPKDDVLLSCYPARLNRILLSLLQNAMEAIDDQGEIRVCVQSEADQVQLEIADSGRGIPTDKIATLFEFGFTEKTGRVGLGMGLPNARRLVRQMSGEIAVSSTLGQGTTVRLTLPRVCTRDAAAIAA